MEYQKFSCSKCDAPLRKTEEGVARESAEEWYKVGHNYLYGKNGVKQSYMEAVKCYQKAGEQGHADAQYDLGWCYEYGVGVEQNYTEAVKWYQKAAEQGYKFAQFSLAYCYEKGYGVEQSYTEAMKWYKKADEQGDDRAQKEYDRLKVLGH